MRFIYGLIWAVALSASPLPAAAQAQWLEVQSDNFLIFTDTSEEKGRRLAADLEGRLAAFERAFGSVTPRQLPVEVFLFRRGADFDGAVPPALVETMEGSAFLLKGPDRVFVVARDHNPADIANSVGHALGHVFFERLGLWRPFWLAEGAAEYFRKVERNPESRRINPNDGFDAADLLRIVQSATYDDAIPVGVFRIQAHRLLRVILDGHEPAFQAFLDVLRREDGSGARPQIDEDLLTERLYAYAETRIPAEPYRSEIRVQAVDTARVDVRRGDMMIAAGRNPDATRFYTLAQTPDSVAAQAILARLSRTDGEAVRAITRAVGELSEHGLLQYHFGSIRTTVPADIQLQVAALERAVQLLPLMGRAQAELARVYILTGRAADALPLLDRALDLEPEFADRFYELRAEAMIGLERFEDAQRDIRLAAALPHADRSDLEAFDVKIRELNRRIEEIRWQAESARVSTLRAQVEARVAELEPLPPPPPPPPPPRTGRVTYEIEAAMRVEIVSQAYPLYPDALVQQGTAGKIALQVNVGADGRVITASVVQSDIPELNVASIDAARKWTFAPVLRSGRPAAFSVRLVFQYISQ